MTSTETRSAVLQNNVGTEYKIFALFMSVYVFLSGFVFVDPAPADLLFVLFLPFLLLSFSTTWEITFLSLLILVPMAISGFVGYVLLAYFNTRFFIIDVYLFVFFFIVSSFTNRIRNHIPSEKFLNSIMRGWILAGFLNILAGLFAYMTGQTNLFGANVIRFGIRLQGFFKDPNVLGPFLVPPAAYFMKLYLENDDKKLLNTIGFFFLSFGVLITFSRAAWLNYATTVLLIFITLSKNLKRTLQVLLILTLSLVIILLFFNLTSNVDILGYNIKDLFFSRLGLQSYDQERFSSQSQFDDILSSTSILFGAGPGNYEYFSGMATHSLFARYLGERGFVGFILFVFFLCTVFYKIAKSPYKTFLIPVLIGQLVNAIFVDTLHWRHLWLLFSLAFV